MARPTFDTSDYRRSHGKEPRGKGCWAFNPNQSDGPDWVFSPSMTFSEAKEWAREHCPEATNFMVGP